MFNDNPVCAPVEGVDPAFVPQMIKQAMAVHYCKRVPGLSLDEGMEAAQATWETEWGSDPEPRTFEAAIDEVDGDLEHWGDEG
jgi:hypothetical protein